MSRPLLFALALVFMSAATAKQTSTPSTANSPVLSLYQERYELDQVELEKARLNLDYLQVRLKKLEEVFSHGALPEATYNLAVRDTGLERLKVKGLEIKVKQAAAMVEIAKQRIMAGGDMPVCFRD